MRRVGRRFGEAFRCVGGVAAADTAHCRHSRATGVHLAGGERGVDVGERVSVAQRAPSLLPLLRVDQPLVDALRVERVRATQLADHRPLGHHLHAERALEGYHAAIALPRALGDLGESGQRAQLLPHQLLGQPRGRAQLCERLWIPWVGGLAQVKAGEACMVVAGTAALVDVAAAEDIDEADRAEYAANDEGRACVRR